MRGLLLARGACAKELLSSSKPHKIRFKKKIISEQAQKTSFSRGRRFPPAKRQAYLLASKKQHRLGLDSCGLRRTRDEKRGGITGVCVHSALGAQLQSNKWSSGFYTLWFKVGLLGG